MLRCPVMLPFTATVEVARDPQGAPLVDTSLRRLVIIGFRICDGPHAGESAQARLALRSDSGVSTANAQMLFGDTTIYPHQVRKALDSAPRFRARCRIVEDPEGQRLCIVMRLIEPLDAPTPDEGLILDTADAAPARPVSAETVLTRPRPRTHND